MQTLSAKTIEAVLQCSRLETLRWATASTSHKVREWPAYEHMLPALTARGKQLPRCESLRSLDVDVLLARVVLPAMPNLTRLAFGGARCECEDLAAIASYCPLLEVLEMTLFTADLRELPAFKRLRWIRVEIGLPPDSQVRAKTTAIHLPRPRVVRSRLTCSALSRALTLFVPPLSLTRCCLFGLDRSGAAPA